MRVLYTFLLYLTLPYLLARLLWRSRRLPAYRKRLGERLGYYSFDLTASIWVHAVSVGETIAAAPLITALLTRYPELPMVVTTMTPTGAERVKAIFGDRVIHAYLPYDLPTAIKRFLAAAKPIAGMMMETELWPNLIAACAQQRIPLAIVNARLSAKSARGYQAIASLTTEMLRALSFVAANSKADAERFSRLGATKVAVTGNIKFDLTLPVDLPAKAQELRRELGNNRIVWIAASTHAGEEEAVLLAHQLVRTRYPQALLILVPRHPDRFEAVARLCAASFDTKRRSKQEVCTQATAVYLADTMGELLLLYAASDMVFIGGSLVPQGGHNLIEPAALAKPLMAGPHLFNFAEISEIFLSANALTIANDADSLAGHINHLIENPDLVTQSGRRAKEVVAANRGVLAKQLTLVETMLHTATCAAANSC